MDVGRKKGLCHKHDFSLLQLDLEDLKDINRLLTLGREGAITVANMLGELLRELMQSKASGTKMLLNISAQEILGVLKDMGINDVQSFHIGLPSANMHRRK